MVVFLFIVPVVALDPVLVIAVPGIIVVFPVIVAVLPVITVSFPVIVNQVSSASIIELIVSATSPLWVRICISDHEFCGWIVFFNSFHFT